MRSFGPQDEVKPVLSPQAARANRLPARYQRPALLLVAAVLAGFTFYLSSGPGGSVPGAVLTACMALLALIVTFKTGKESGPVLHEFSPFTSGIVKVLFLIGVLAVTAVYWNESPAAAVVVAAFAGVCAVFFLLTAVRGVQNRRIARLMRANTPAAPVPETPQVDSSDPSAAPSVHLDIYQLHELPPLPWSYEPQVTSERNIIGLPPKPILYLYNFFAIRGLENKLAGGWRRFGPVYFLGSPQDISFGNTFTRNIAESVKPLLVTSCESFDERLAAASEIPLPPGHEQLKGTAYLSGGYPHHLFLCTDETWRYAVTKLFGKAGLVIIDAAGYQPERGGLNWELEYVVNHVPAAKFVVLMDSESDQTALVTQFRKAWANMWSESPNHERGSGAVRLVLLNEMPDAVQDTTPQQPDPCELCSKLSLFERKMLDARYLRYLTEDRIFELLMQSAETDRC